MNQLSTLVVAKDLSISHHLNLLIALQAIVVAIT